MEQVNELAAAPKAVLAVAGLVAADQVDFAAAEKESVARLAVARAVAVGLVHRAAAIVMPQAAGGQIGSSEVEEPTLAQPEVGPFVDCAGNLVAVRHVFAVEAVVFSA